MSPPIVDLRGQTAVVTGGGAGIGRGIALALASCGANVAVLEIDSRRSAQVVDELGAIGGGGLALTVDVMDSDSIRAAVQSVDECWGRIDVLINNAGGVSGRPFLDQSEASWRRHVDINFMSMLAATSAVVPIISRGSRGGAIVNVSSIEGTRAAPNFAVYAACKAAMLSFTRSMAVEFADRGIRVNAITPDWTRTPGNSGYRTGPVPPHLLRRPDRLEESLRAYIPLQREGTPGECGQVAAFLCSPLASYVTGAVIPVDGGTWASSGWVRCGDGWSLFGPDRPM